ncbi:MAG: sigma-70 family RNA polymerase sigma factor [Myxococcota bacterium]
MSSRHDDVQLVEAALAGRPSSRRRLAERLLDAITREVGIALLRPAKDRGRDPRQDVQDLVQEVLVTLFEHDARELRRWDPQRGRSLESFVRLVARRRVARVLNRHRGHPWGEGELEYQEELDGDLDKRIEDRARLSEIFEALHARMSPRDVELFDLLFVQGLEPTEVASRLEMSRGAVNAWCYRTRKQARIVSQRLANASTTGAEAGGTVGG